MEIFMVAIKKDQHFIVNQFGHPTGILPVNIHPDIGLLHFVEIVVHNNIRPALQAIFHKFFDAGQFIFRDLGSVFTQAQSILAEIGIEIICLVIFPVEFLVLQPVFSKLYCTDLPGGIQGKE